MRSPVPRHRRADSARARGYVPISTVAVRPYPRPVDLLASDGYVLFWRDDKGTGVIRPDNGDRDVWVHLSSVEERGSRTRLDEGERVRVEYRHVEHGPSGRWHGERVTLSVRDRE